MTTRVAVGVDPSIASTGLAVLGAGVQGFARSRTVAGEATVPERLHRFRLQAKQVVDALDGLVGSAAIEVFVVENAAFGSRNQMGHMLAGFWWHLADALDRYYAAPFALVTPATLKKFATGDGSFRTGKVEMVNAAQRAFPEAGIRNDDIADAAALASMGAEWLGWECGGAFAPSGLASVRAVHWPEMMKEN